MAANAERVVSDAAKRLPPRKPGYRCGRVLTALAASSPHRLLEGRVRSGGSWPAAPGRNRRIGSQRSSRALLVQYRSGQSTVPRSPGRRQGFMSLQGTGHLDPRVRNIRARTGAKSICRKPSNPQPVRARSMARLRSPLHDIVLIDVLKNPAGSCRSPLGGHGNHPGIAEIQ